ncbi:MAG: di/tricarboxylate transporter [Luteibaculaceae bacterium]
MVWQNTWRAALWLFPQKLTPYLWLHMTPDQWITLAIVLVAVILFVTEWLSVDVIGMVIISLFMVSGVLTPSEAVKGFSNTATVTIAAMFALSAAILKTGQLGAIGYYLSKVLVKSKTKGILLIMIITGVISAFINNTPVVAVLIPIIIAASVKAKISPSKILIPLSFASMFGGVCTLIGTSTNILVSSIAEENGLRGFGMFEMAPLGLIFFATGVVYLIFFGSKLIPDRGSVKELTQKFEMENYLTDIRILPEAPSVGKVVSESPIIKELEIDVIGFRRDSERFSELHYSEVLKAGDVLRLRGNITQIKKIRAREGIEIIEGKWNDEHLTSKDVSIAEAIISPNSELDHKTISETRFKLQYKAIVLAIKGRKGILHEKLSQTVLKSGDLLLLRIKNEFLKDLKSPDRINESPLLIISEAEEQKPVELKKLIIVFSILFFVILLAALNIIPIMASSIIGVTMLVIFRSLTIKEAYQAINWQVVFLIAGAISMGLAMEKTGTAQLGAEKLIGLFGDWGPTALLSVLYLLSFLLTGIISNSAAAVLLAPIAISTANSLGVDARPFLFAIAFAASSSFITPVGYQTNTMIYAAGNYKFTDFFRVGLPLNIIFWVLATLLIPIFYSY